MLISSLIPFLFSQAPFNPTPDRQTSTSNLQEATQSPSPILDSLAHHWRPDRPDQYVCEHLGQNDCWQPSILQEGPPYDGFESFRPPRSKICVVEAGNDPSHDDAPAIRKAFGECGEDAHVLFQNTTYYVHTVLNTTGLRNVDIEIQGTLAWDNSDIDYWLTNSLYIGFQNQTTAWILGGSQIHFFGHGHGTLNGNGQVWYNYANATSNLHGRPHAITVSDTVDSVIERLNFIKSQMWTMTVARSERVLLQDIYVNNSYDPGPGTFQGCNMNTDGCDTVYANNITFKRWTIDNGDDGISLKQNSTNIYVKDSKFYHGTGAIVYGSVGQYPGQVNVIENFTARNIYVEGMNYAAYLKTWTGVNKGYPPNGGGGGLGYARNLSCVDFTIKDVAWAWMVNQKTSYNGETGGEDTSHFQIEDLTFANASGTIKGDFMAAFNAVERRLVTNCMYRTVPSPGRMDPVRSLAVDAAMC